MEFDCTGKMPVFERSRLDGLRVDKALSDERAGARIEYLTAHVSSAGSNSTMNRRRGGHSSTGPWTNVALCLFKMRGILHVSAVIFNN